MLPSISSGHFGIVSKPVYGSNSVHGISHVNKPLQDSFDCEEDRSCPSLPLISEGSFTSLVSKKSGKSLEKNKEREGKDYEVTSSRADFDMGRSGFKTTQLQLNCELKNADRGWYPQGLNPRLANSSRTSQLPAMGLHMMSTSERLLLHHSLDQPVGSLHKKKHQAAVDRKAYLMNLGGQTVFNTRYRMPVTSSLLSQGKEAVAGKPSHVPESNPVNLLQKSVANRPAGIAIHSRCCCRRHKQDSEQRATFKSRSSESLIKERVSKGKKEGSVVNQSNHGNTFNNEKKVKPTDRPPPKKMPTGFIVGQPRRKSKRINVLASDSSSSLQEERKKLKRSPPKQTRQKYPKSPEQKSSDILPTVSSPVKESPAEELMIYIENAQENPPCTDVGKEVDELMDVEYNVEEKELDNRGQTDGLDVISVRSATACDPQRSTTPRLLKVTSEVKMDPALAKVFQKLDTDGDGHISFADLKKSLPPQLTRQQINYLKKIYDMACESTYFGLEEFTATHQMCGLLAQSSPVVSNALSNLESSSLDVWLSDFVESFSKADKNQRGIINMQSFENMLASIIKVHPNSFIIQEILGSLGKLPCQRRFVLRLKRAILALGGYFPAEELYHLLIKFKHRLLS